MKLVTKHASRRLAMSESIFRVVCFWDYVMEVIVHKLSAVMSIWNCPTVHQYLIQLHCSHYTMANAILNYWRFKFTFNCEKYFRDWIFRWVCLWSSCWDTKRPCWPIFIAQSFVKDGKRSIFLRNNTPLKFGSDSYGRDSLTTRRYTIAQNRKWLNNCVVASAQILPRPMLMNIHLRVDMGHEDSLGHYLITYKSEVFERSLMIHLRSLSSPSIGLLCFIFDNCRNNLSTRLMKNVQKKILKNFVTLLNEFFFLFHFATK